MDLFAHVHESRESLEMMVSARRFQLEQEEFQQESVSFFSKA
jgi:hypothetical protein